MFQVCNVDIVHMEPSNGKHYLVMLRCNLSGWIEGRALANADAKSVAKFLWEELFCRHGCPGRIIMDGGPENKDVVALLLQVYNVKRIIISAYNAQANGAIEVGHRPIKDSLAKMKHAGMGPWIQNLHAVLWADRVTVKGPTGISPFKMLHGNIAVLPIDLEHPT
jgi:hypothetical protein